MKVQESDSYKSKESERNEVMITLDSYQNLRSPIPFERMASHPE
jgi:hypothetical protein